MRKIGRRLSLKAKGSLVDRMDKTKDCRVQGLASESRCCLAETFVARDSSIEWIPENRCTVLR